MIIIDNFHCQMRTHANLFRMKIGTLFMSLGNKFCFGLQFHIHVSTNCTNIVEITNKKKGK